MEPEKHKRDVLEKYFYDLKALFLRRFEIFNADTMLEEHDILRLSELFKEIIYVKSVLDETHSTR
jgi:hypothetical protein